MKTVISKTLVTLTGILFVVPFLVVALLIGERAAETVQVAHGDWLLIALTVGGVCISIVNDLSVRRPSQAARPHANEKRNPLHRYSWTLSAIKPLKLF